MYVHDKVIIHLLYTCRHYGPDHDMHWEKMTKDKQEEAKPD